MNTFVISAALIGMGCGIICIVIGTVMIIFGFCEEVKALWKRRLKK